MQAVIETRNLTKSFNGLTAVDEVSLSVKEGEMFGLVGPDGAGKTTLIRMLCGILLPTSGSATLLGKDLLKQSDLIKKEIGYLSQRFSLYGDLTIDENIEFFAEISKVFDYRDRRNELLEFTRLTPFRDRLADKLSGGMKQKLPPASTLIHTPKIILLDEPTTGVDPVSRRDFWKILQSLLKGGITIVMSTPYLDEAERCSTVAMMSRGKLLRVDAPGRLRTEMRGDILEIVCDRVREAYTTVQHHPLVREVQAFGDRLNIVVADASADAEKVISFLKEKGFVIENQRTIPPSLENIFISLLTHMDEEEKQA